jgi:hypothetical protein
MTAMFGIKKEDVKQVWRESTDARLGPCVQAKKLREEKDAAERRSKNRLVEIDRLKKLHEVLDKKEPMLEKEEQRLRQQLQERQVPSPGLYILYIAYP